MKVMSFHYHLGIEFGSPVHDHSFTLRCIPQSDERQQIKKLDFAVSPSNKLSESFDDFGNKCITGCTKVEHQKFEIDVCGVVKTGTKDSVAVADDYREHIYRYATDLTQADDNIKTAAAGFKGKDELALAEEVMAFLKRHMVYTQNVTDICTTAAESFAMGAGVCQDYAHIMLAMLRYRGVSARYVVGMIPGEGASHAWVEVRSGEAWYGFDPTNDTKVGDGYIKISHGRDYNDCVINRGFFYGDGRQRQVVSVKVTEMEQEQNI